MTDLRGKNVVVTGVIGGESRQTAEAKLRDAGAQVQSSVGKTTDLLVTGGRVGKTKIDAAAKHGAEVVSWEALWSGERHVPEVPVTVITDQGVGPGVLTSDEHGDIVRMVERRAYGPMLAKAGDLPSGPDWLFEVKWDGLRCIARVATGMVTMTSRSAKSDYVDRFPHIAELLSRWPDIVLDGELVVLDDTGRSSLGSISNRAGASYIVFDVLELAGNDVSRLPLNARRRILEDTLKDVFELAGGGRIAVSPVFDDGEELLAEVSSRNLEGLIAKKRTGSYVEGSRSWIKVKLRNQQEFVVLGWTPGEGALEGTLGGLVLGVRENGRWLYVGRVGTGLVDEDRRSLRSLLSSIELIPNVRDPEIDVGKTARAELREVVWVDPLLVVDVAFQKWTPDRRLLIPSYKGLREDKAAIEVTAKP